MDDAFWVSMQIIVPALCTVIGTIVLAFFQHRTKTALVEQGDAAAAKTEEVSDQLSVTGTHTEVKLHEIKTLVNGGVEKSLRVAAVALRTLADETGKEGHIAAAVLAEKELAQHVAAQIEVDLAHKDKAVAVAKEIAKAPSSIGTIVGETLADVKVVKQDVKDLKDESEKE